MKKVIYVFSIIFITSINCKFPNEIVDTPIVSCEPEKIVIKVRTTASNPSHIYAEDFRESTGCLVRNMNHIVINHGECGMTSEKMANPDGTMYRVCIAVQIHPLFVTESDRSYCAQCVYMDSNVVNDLEQNIAISDAPPSELEPQFDEAARPKCSYIIRKDSVDGPEIHFATIGDTVFHVWQCENEHVGILVQNCHVEDLEGNKILIIDQNGCGIDQYVLNTPQYSEDLRTAFQETKVFKFADKTMTRFTCQLRLCMKDRNNGCEKITPPKACSNIVKETVGHDLPLPPPQKLIGNFNELNGGPPSIVPPEFAAKDTGLRKSSGINGIRHAQVGVTGFGRGRREIEIYGNGTKLLKRNRRVTTVNTNDHDEMLPEMNVVGMIRVLDSPEDVQYYESKFTNKLEGFDQYTELTDKKCMSTSLYWSLIATLMILITIQFVALAVIFIDKFVLNRTFISKFRSTP